MCKELVLAPGNERYALIMSTLRPGPAELAVGDRLGPYRLELLLGQGAMGLVYRAVRTSDGDTVALKVLRAELTEDALYRRRFEREARSAAQVRHAHLVPVLDAGELEGRLYLVVGYVPGTTLEQRVCSEGSLTPADLLRVVAEIASGLDALHGHGIVHRDVKASNILLHDEGTALLTDFGLARGQAYTVLTRTGQVIGTIGYLAPELLRGEQATPASDLYALGCVAYECATGSTPFGDRSVFEVGLAHLEEEPPDPRQLRPDLSPSLAGALLSALDKEPARRPPNAGAYAGALRTAARRT
jgi:serine/threonine-protein kinase